VRERTRVALTLQQSCNRAATELQQKVRERTRVAPTHSLTAMLSLALLSPPCSHSPFCHPSGGHRSGTTYEEALLQLCCSSVAALLQDDMSGLSRSVAALLQLCCSCACQASRQHDMRSTHRCQSYQASSKVLFSSFQTSINLLLRRYRGSIRSYQGAIRSY
jgi:hypothetical protein